MRLRHVASASLLAFAAPFVALVTGCSAAAPDGATTNSGSGAVVGEAADAGNGDASPDAIAMATGPGYGGAAANFTLPNIGAPAGKEPFEFPSSDTDSVTPGDAIKFVTLDIDADGIPDLVVTRLQSDPTIGRTKWEVYKGSATGFAMGATDFTLPDIGADVNHQPFEVISSNDEMVTPEEKVEFATLDVDGDKLLDLVVTRIQSDPLVGRTKWKVYKGSATGFAAAAIDFTLPDIGAAANKQPFEFPIAEKETVTASDFINFTTIDVDGDKMLDLVITRRESMALVGQTKWLVFKGSASGFAAAPTDFTLPDVGAAVETQPFELTIGTKETVTAGDTINFTTIDIDGDKILDLVLTRRDTDPTIGLAGWKVFKGTGAGFATAATVFTLPSVGAETEPGIRPFETMTATKETVVAGDTINFASFDIDGDKMLDLVVTRRITDPTIGQTTWKVYKGSATGFATASTDFALPEIGVAKGNEPFEQIGGSAEHVTPADTINFATLDVDGDGKLDIVITRRISDPTIGNAGWKMFKGK